MVVAGEPHRRRRPAAQQRRNRDVLTLAAALAVDVSIGEVLQCHGIDMEMGLGQIDKKRGRWPCSPKGIDGGISNDGGAL
jgi:hypothetical protein